MGNSAAGKSITVTRFVCLSAVAIAVRVDTCTCLCLSFCHQFYRYYPAQLVVKSITLIGGLQDDTLSPVSTLLPPSIVTSVVVCRAYGSFPQLVDLHGTSPTRALALSLTDEGSKQPLACLHQPRFDPGATASNSVFSTKYILFALPMCGPFRGDESVGTVSKGSSCATLWELPCRVATLFKYRDGSSQFPLLTYFSDESPTAVNVCIQEGLNILDEVT